jgi:hypothetical protein
MKQIFIAMLFFAGIACYGQAGATGANGAPVGAYKPAMNSDTPVDPADRPPLTVLKDDPKLVAKLQKLLPQQTTPERVCDGFKKLSDCVSAIHVAQNLSLPIFDLKNKVIAEKGHDALEKAIHEMKPDADAKAERKKAQKQAERDMPVSD